MPQSFHVSGCGSRGGARSAVAVGGGGLAHGDAFDITGSGFGTITTPLVYDDFSVGTIGASTQSQAAIIGSWDTGNGITRYANDKARGAHSRTSKHNFSADNVSGACALPLSDALSNGEDAYIDWWMWFSGGVYDDVDNSNFKIIRWFGTDGTATPEMNWVNIPRGAPATERLTCIPVDDNGAFVNVFDSSPSQRADVLDGSWHHYQLLLRCGSTVAADRFIGAVDCVKVNDETDGLRSANTSSYVDLRIGYYQHSPYFDLWTSSVYVSKSVSRVEVGNNSVYGSCTIREIQPCSASDWTNTSIHIPHFNKGSLSSGTNYWFVSTALSFGTPTASGTITVA